jgi:hypothetical protein
VVDISRGAVVGFGDMMCEGYSTVMHIKWKPRTVSDGNVFV